jgi:hypothetical protein
MLGGRRLQAEGITVADPAATLKAEGMELPVGVSFKAHENTDKVVHLVIPAKPTDLSDEDLANVTGGSLGSTKVDVCIGGCRNTI